MARDFSVFSPEEAVRDPSENQIQSMYGVPAVRMDTETEARKKATLAAKSYGWTVMEHKHRKQHRNSPEKINNNNGGRRAKCSSSYGLYGEVLQMLPFEEFNKYVKDHPTSMTTQESKRDGHRILPSARRRPPRPELSLVIPGGEGGRAGQGVPLVYPVSPMSTALGPLSEAGDDYLRL